MTGLLGYVGNISWMYIWVAMVATFALVVWAAHRIQTPIGKKKEKIDAFYQVCAESFRLTGNLSEDQAPFFSAINHAEAVFYEDENVRNAFDRLRKEKGHESILLPDLIETMGQVVNKKVDKETLSTPFSPAQK